MRVSLLYGREASHTRRDRCRIRRSECSDSVNWLGMRRQCFVVIEYKVLLFLNVEEMKTYKSDVPCCMSY